MLHLASSPPKQSRRKALAARWQRLRSEGANGRLRGWALVAARVVWLVIAALTVALFVAVVWVQVAQLRVPCRVIRGPISRASLVLTPGCPHGEVPLAVQQALAAIHLSVGLYAAYAVVLNVVFAAAFVAVAALIFWRRSADLWVLYVSLTLLVFGTLSFQPLNSWMVVGLTTASPGWRLPIAILAFLGVAAFAVFMFVFPDGHFVPRWTRLLAFVWVLWFLPEYLLPDSPFSFSAWPAGAYFGCWAFFLSAVCAAQIYRYRHVSTAVQRVQTKWVVFGFLATGIGYFGGQLLMFFPVPGLASPQAVLAYLAGTTLTCTGVLLIPICIGIAILRHHLFDIDVLIKQTLIYSILVASLALLYEGAVLVMAKALLAITGQASLFAEVGAAFGVGALAEPVHRGIDRSIARVFNRRQYEVERHIEDFSRRLRREWQVVPRSQEWEEALEQRMEHAWAAMWHRHAQSDEHNREYVQEPLFTDGSGEG